MQIKIEKHCDKKPLKSISKEAWMKIAHQQHVYLLIYIYQRWSIIYQNEDIVKFVFKLTSKLINLSLIHI